MILLTPAPAFLPASLIRLFRAFADAGLADRLHGGGHNGIQHAPGQFGRGDAVRVLAQIGQVNRRQRKRRFLSPRSVRMT